MNTGAKSRELLRTCLLAALAVAALLLCSCDKYEQSRKVVGTYTPSRCVTLQGIIPGGLLSHHRTIHPTICQPVAVGELGIYTYGGGWSRPGVQSEGAPPAISRRWAFVETRPPRATGRLTLPGPPEAVRRI